MGKRMVLLLRPFPAGDSQLNAVRRVDKVYRCSIIGLRQPLVDSHDGAKFILHQLVTVPLAIDFQGKSPAAADKS